MNHLMSAWTRAARGLREEAGIHLVAISSLTIAFVCLGAMLVAVANLGALAEALGHSARMTVYLRDDADPRAVSELRTALEALPEVRSIQLVDGATARDRFLRESELDSDLLGLVDDAFPASLEVELAAEITRDQSSRLAERIGRFGAVEEVETYRAWLARLESLFATGRLLALALGILVVISVVLVVGNTIRLAVAGRRDEIEVLKLCGATDAFVRGPFIIEGAVQGGVASILAAVVLIGGLSLVHDPLEATLSALGGIHMVSMPPLVTLALVLGGTSLGAVGSAISLRRYLTV